MLLTVHDSKMHKVAFLDNTKEKTLNYYEDMWIEDLVKVTNTFDFSIDKKELEADTVNKKAYQVLSERSFISFTFMGRKMLFNVMNIKERGGKIQVFCEDLNLELLNENVTSYEATTKMSFVDYCVAFNILNFGAITIGHNEIEDYERVLKWEGTENKHQRLISLARQFDAEIEFRTYLNKDSSLKSLVMNVYKKNDGKKHQGVGKRRDDIILINDRNVDDIERSIGKEKIKTMMTPTGKKTVDVVITKPNPKYVAPTARTVSYSGGGLVYAGRSISKSNVQALLSYCTQYKLLPSGVLSQLFVESFWGKSTVGQVDNNWGGMTWTGSTTRPSGVTVSRGMARPASEGGYYNHYASVADYFKDYTYLIAEQGLYKVKGKDSLEAFTKGLFREGGALYDYAAIGYKHYIYSMKDVRYNINRLNNKAMDNLDDLFRGKGTVGVAPVSKVASQTKAVLNEMAGLKGHRIGNGQCYGLSAWYAMKLGGAGLNGGVTSFRGLRPGGGSAASNIGEDYNWSQFGWKVVVPSKVEHLIAGSIANIRANAGGPVYTGAYGHTVTIKSLSGDTLTVYEQNFAGHQYVEERTYSASAYLRVIQTLVYPPEIVQGKRVEATATTAVTTTPIVESGNNEPKTISETQQKEKITTIDPTIYREWKNAKGEVEFYLKNGSIYAPLAKELYPSVLSGEEVGDDWLKERMELETDDQEILITEALEALKKICYPALTYDVDAYEPSLNAGDTIKIVDRKFHPTLTLEARATRQERSFTAPSKNKTKFDNYRALESKMPASLQSRYEELNELAKPYDLRLITSNGQTFKNGIGSSVITAEVWKNNKLFDATFQFKNVDTLISSGLTCLINANEIPETYVVTIEAYIGNEFIASKQLTFSNVNDGQDGVGVNSTSVTYAISTSASVQPTTWTEAMPVATAEQYLWTRKITDYTDPSKPDTIELTYSYQGKNGSAGTSVSVTKIEYQVGTSGTTAPTGTWSTGLPVVPDGQFLWMKVTFSDGNIATMPGKQGAVGPKGDKGDTYYPHTAWANSADGKTDFSTTDSAGRRYKGDYSDTNVNGSTDPTKYKWVDMVGSVQVGGVNLLAISKVVNGYIAAANGTVNPSYYPDGVLDQFIDVPDDATLIYQAWNPKLVTNTTKSGKIAYYDSVGAYLGTYFFIPQFNGTPYQKAITKLPSNVKKIKINVVLNDDIKIKIEFGNIPTAYTQAPEDIDAKIDTKADDALTQEQLLAIAEEQRLMKANLEATASLEEFQNKSKELLDQIQAIADGQKVSEQVLTDNASRIVQLVGQIGAMNLVTEAITRYMSFSDDGLIIGMKDGSSSVRVANDRISFYSAGKETAFISQGFLQIESGIFTLRLQIASFLFEESASGQLLIKKIR